MIYPLLRNILFAFPPEDVHYFSMNILQSACNRAIPRRIIKNLYTPENPKLSREVFGLNFKNPVGLGAGFDKNAIYLTALDALGFGFVEIGTVTPMPQPGNDKPRLFRLPKDRALINRMGFNNNGVKAIAGRLSNWRNEQHAQPNTKNPLIVGGNIGKNKITENENAWKDYEICFNELFDTVDYFTVNVSSPNTPGLRALQEKDSLRRILSHLQTINHGKNNPKPILLKIAPDLNTHQLDDIAGLAFEIQLDGIVATNTTIERKNLQTPQIEIEKIGNGGLSGQPLQMASTQVVQYISGRTEGKIPIIASGGIFTGEDAKSKLNAGAALVQVWTGFIYEGPAIVKNICDHL